MCLSKLDAKHVCGTNFQLEMNYEGQNRVRFKFYCGACGRKGKMVSSSIGSTNDYSLVQQKYLLKLKEHSASVDSFVAVPTGFFNVMKPVAHNTIN